ncbi:5-oxoprolinase subunit PxpA [Kineococcus sp. NPDC059986]|uniref:LamB/YcsF family protein n=1 Tax=Kineococcus sp. NPDC059986 TaxID=3155538 RepID=UPI0034500860
MTTVDLNSDLGENTPDRPVSDDAAMLAVVSSANVSCGFHAGSPEGIRETVLAASRAGVAIGAHPGYRDYENFGRERLDLPAATLQAHVEYQLGAVWALARSVGDDVVYVKPHGALYNTMAVDEGVAAVVVAAVKAVDPSLVLLGLAGGVALDVADRAGLATAAEAFADRAYTPGGQLVSRKEPGAVLHDADLVARRMVRLVEDGVVEAVEGTDVPVRAQSLCVHGDSPGAVRMASAVRAALTGAGVQIAPFVVRAP